jgi:hypothetical protein
MGERRADSRNRIIRELRGLVPDRGLEHAEALFMAEVQATRLLRLAKVVEPSVPVTEIAGRVGVTVGHDADQQCMGRAESQVDGTWHISFKDARLPHQNAIIAHELKHIVDYQHGVALYPPVDVMATEYRWHYVAEYFATCLTLPRAFVERSWYRGEQDAQQLAELFETTPEAMLSRLRTLRLIEPDSGLSSLARGLG